MARGVALPAAPAPTGAAAAPASASTEMREEPTGVPASRIESLRWSGDIPPSKWTLFFSKVLSRLSQGGGLAIRADVVASPEGGLSVSQIEDIRQGLVDLDLRPPAVYSGASPAGGDLTLAALLAEGEGAHVEFKATARYNVHTSSADKAVEAAMVKAVAGFLNSEGGRLIVGVEDSGRVVGIDPDISTLKQRQSRDGFEQFVRNALNQRLDRDEVSRITIGFQELEGKAVCVISIPRARRPVYCDDDGRQVFYVRSGNTTQPFTVEEAVNHITAHFYR